jgi:alpha-tubulin suppressor-like RCC1 family protein
MEATTRFVALAAGGGHSLALQSNGVVWSWGENTYGQLGMGTTSEDECTPHRITFPHQLPVKSIAAGYAHSAALTQDGSVFTFGWGLYHQLGHGATENCPLPTRVDALDGIDHGMREVACGTWHTAAVSSQGDVYTWGWGPDGQLVQ